MEDQLVTVAEAAARLAVSPKTVYRLVNAGKFHPRPAGLGQKRRGVRIAKSELDAYIATAA